MKNRYEVHGDITVIIMERRDGVVVETIIDTSDLEKADSFPNKWFACFDKGTNSYYVHGHVTRTRGTQLHRWLMDEPIGMDIDHMNHDTLDNRRSCNLKAVTHAKNTMNKRGAHRDSISGIRGVSWHKRSGKWAAKICIGGKDKHLGYFDDIHEAAKVAKAARDRLAEG